MTPEDKGIPSGVIRPMEFCDAHFRRLVHGAGYLESEPWRALTVVAMIAMFQAASAEASVQERLGGEIERIRELGCLACLLPEKFSVLVRLGRTKDLGDLKALGEQWVREAAK